MLFPGPLWDSTAHTGVSGAGLSVKVKNVGDVDTGGKFEETDGREGGFL